MLPPNSILRLLRIFLLMSPLLMPPTSANAQVMNVVVGVTPTCPYGCWASAYEALGRLKGVNAVAQAPDLYNCTFTVSTDTGRLPDVEEWSNHFKSTVNGGQDFRGVEVTVAGTIDQKDGQFILQVPQIDKAITLHPLAHKLQWNFNKRSVRQPEADESSAYQDLKARISHSNATIVQVTGPLTTSKAGACLEVREFFMATRHGKE